MELTVTRGDTLPIVINIKDNDTSYELQEGDILTFTVKRNTKVDTEPLIQKIMTSETGAACELTPEDTSVPYGKYKYDLELALADGRVFTIIKPSVFSVTEEVTTHDNS